MKAVISFGTLLICIATAFGQAKPKTSPKPAPKPDITVKIAEFEKDYSVNPVAADKKYKGKTIDLTGTIEEIGRVSMSSATYISFKTDGPTILAHFLKSEEDLLLKVKKGDTVSVIGYCAGMPSDKKIYISRCSALKLADK